ncbi:MAG: hypothetical protein ABJP48_02530 [Erythrobacter sp.]
MLSTTVLEGGEIPDEVRAVFSEVSVFFAAMTKAITQAVDPVTNKPYSLYNYNAIQNVIDGSGLFVHVTEEDIEHKTESFGMQFSKELIEGLLGLATGAGALSFAQGMIASMGKAGLAIGGDHESSDNKVANIVFICEYLLGMPVISAMVVYCDAKENHTAFSVGPCFKGQTTSTTLKMHKDTYLFVTPKFIKEYSADLDSVTTDLAYLEFVDYLQALVQGSPIITAIEDLNGDGAPDQLKVNKTYAILGAFLDNGRKKVTSGAKKGDPTVKVAWVGANGAMGAEVTNAEVQPNIISFSVASATSTSAAIGVFFTDDKGANPILAVASEGTYTAATTPS